MTMEAVDVVTSDSNESTVPLKNNPGRTFRDGVRKIDLILVMKDEENLIGDPMKNNFLTNIVKTGLEIEFENGVLPIHKKLLFFKVHCPNDVLNNLGKAFGVKCVQIARAEHIMSNKERDWINLIRKAYTQPLQYSSLERSLVVYMTLLNVPFGDRQNYIGLERLMKRNIVVEAYALHDGPYFLTQDATSINARQILFYNWVGITNIFTKQPLNVVHEYFGPKVALYFAYYGLYNLFLAIASLAALITLFLAIFFNKNYMDLRAPICEDKYLDICFQCLDKSQVLVGCYFYHLFYFCDWYKINVLMDNKYAPYFATFIVLWGIFFTAYWFGREKYFNWIWETRNKNFNRNQIRPEFHLNLDTARKSNKTGLVIGIHRGSKFKTLLWYIPVILLDAFVLFIFASRKTLFTISPNALMVRLMVMMTVFVAVLLIIDFIHRKIASYIVRMENHRTYISYNRSLTKHQYIMCFSLPMIVLACYGFHKAIFEFQFWRGYKMDDKFLLDETCVLTSCINELAIAFTIVLLLRFVILRKLSRYSSTTDYNQRAIVQNVPCWEREFVLPRLKESILANKMMMLVIQLTFIIAFGFSCTPTIIFVLFFNIYNMRRDAELFTLHYRRPLFLKNKSFSIWSEILKLMVYLAIFVNVVSLVCSTDTIEAYLREQRKPTGNTLDQYLNLFFNNFTLLKGAYGLCYARAYIHISKDIDIKREELTVDELKTYQYMYIFIFEIIMASLFLLMQYIFSIDVDEKEIPKKREQEN